MRSDFTDSCDVNFRRAPVAMSQTHTSSSPDSSDIRDETPATATPSQSERSAAQSRRFGQRTGVSAGQQRSGSGVQIEPALQ